jgi:FAD/FMN-containing dehydrogenase
VASSSGAFAAAASDHSTVDVWYHGGAMSRIPADATAFGDRPQILLGYEANFEERDAADANVAWVRNSIEELKPYSTGGAYLNFPGFFEEGDALLRASFGDANYGRLVALKTEYDPTNLFRVNGNIRPSA